MTGHALLFDPALPCAPRHSTGRGGEAPVLRLVLLLALAGQPLAGRAAESDSAPPPFDSQQTVAAPPTAAEVLAKMQLPEDFHATVFAAEPELRQPIGLATDERGRLWVAENYTYAESQLNFETRLYDRIVILQDSDQDGRSDRRTVFYDKAQKLTSVAVGFGGVWALCAPQLLFIPDRNHDDVPDGEPEVVLDGWNDDAVRHNIVNGLTWGPDGWLYGRHGILATSLVGRPGASAAERVQLNCGIWRYHPVQRRFEAVAHGTTNPWGCDFDDFGQMFFSNTVIGHLWHVVPGAHFRRMYGSDFDPHLYQLMEQCADHYHWDTREVWSDVRKGLSDRSSELGGGHAHSGLMIYLGDNWPDRYRHSAFMVNLHGLRLNQDRLERFQSGYVARHAADLLQVEDPWFRGIEMIYGPDGGVYVADWADIGECHENDGVHRSTGRIYKIVYRQPPAPLEADLRQCTEERLVELQLQKNDWYARQARRLLQERAAEGQPLRAAEAALRRMFDEHPDVTRKLRALWCLHAMQRWDSAALLAGLQHPEEHIRVWSVRLGMDAAPPPAGWSAALARRATAEQSPLVRLFCAAALQKLPLGERWDLAQALAAHREDAEDLPLSLMLWYGLEPAVPVYPEQALQLAAASRNPLLVRHISRRLTADIEDAPQPVAQLTGLLRQRPEPAWRLEVLQGMADALRGWQRAPAPEGWAETARILLAAAPTAPDRTAADPAAGERLVQELGVVFGDGRAVEELRKLAETADADPESRRQALRKLVEAKVPDLLPLLQKFVGDRALTVEAIRGLARFEDPRVPQLILEQYPRLAAAARQEAVSSLASRPAYARALVEAVEQGRIEGRDISAFHVRQLRAYEDPQLDERLRKLWGEIRETPADKRQQMEAIKAELTPEALRGADLSQGRYLYQKSCANCHKLYGEGGTVAPDLTGSNRHNVDYLLENVVDPNALVPTDFKVSLVTLDDGRVLSGVLLEPTERTVTLQTPQERLVLDRRTIEDVVPQQVSLMPEGLLNTLTPPQVRDLMAYLSGRRQVPLPPEAEAAR